MQLVLHRDCRSPHLTQARAILYQCNTQADPILHKITSGIIRVQLKCESGTYKYKSGSGITIISDTYLVTGWQRLAQVKTHQTDIKAGAALFKHVIHFDSMQCAKAVCRAIAKTQSPQC